MRDGGKAMETTQGEYILARGLAAPALTENGGASMRAWGTGYGMLCPLTLANRRSPCRQVRKSAKSFWASVGRGTPVTA